MRNQSKAQLANLDTGKRFSGEYARRCAKKSAEVRQTVKLFSQYIQQELESSSGSGAITKEELSQLLITQALSGNMRAFELLLKLIGEYPQEQKNVRVSGITEDSEDTQKMLEELRIIRRKAE